MKASEARQKLAAILDTVDDLFTLVEGAGEVEGTDEVIEMRRKFLAGLAEIEGLTRFLKHGVIANSRNAGFGIRVNGDLDLRFNTSRELVASGADEHDPAQTNGSAVRPAPGLTRNGTPDLRYSKPKARRRTPAQS